MITQRDLHWVLKLAPVAQLLEVLGTLEKPEVRSGEVFQVMARDVWEAYWYLNARLNDEIIGLHIDSQEEKYFDSIEQTVRRLAE